MLNESVIVIRAFLIIATVSEVLHNIRLESKLARLLSNEGIFDSNARKKKTF